MGSIDCHRCARQRLAGAHHQDVLAPTQVRGRGKVGRDTHETAA